MQKILVVAELRDGQLNNSTAKCVSCAVAMQPTAVDIVVLGEHCADAAGQAARIAGINRVLVADDPRNAHQLAAVLAPQVAALAADYDCILGPSTTFGKDLVPRIAALLDSGQVSDIMQVAGARTFVRPVYAGNALLTVEVPAGQKIVATVRTASWPEARLEGTAAIEHVTIQAETPTHTRFVSLASADSGRPDLQSAKRVISGGRGVGSADNFKLIYQLADRLGAAVGASRAAVDAGFVANDMQVGQTGKIIAPELYVAIGISGAIQHLTGIKDAGTIVAINKDPEAPIFEVADIGLVGDLFELIPELERELGAAN